MRLWTRMGAVWRYLHAGLLLIMTVLPTITSRGGCPADVKYETNQCLATYNIHTSALGELNFYAGVDVEIIRSVCTALSQSISCVIKLKNSCPENSHSQIMTEVEGPLVNTAELCHVENIYEIYSRHQFCYSRIAAGSKSCADEFAVQISPIQDRLESNPSAQKKYCRYFGQLTRCVFDHVVNNCGNEAATLTEKLVRASFGQSQPCEDEPPPTSTLTPTTLGQVGRTPAQNEAQGGVPVGASNTSTLSTICLVLSLAVTFISNTSLRHR